MGPHILRHLAREWSRFVRTARGQGGGEDAGCWARQRGGHAVPDVVSCRSTPGQPETEPYARYASYQLAKTYVAAVERTWRGEEERERREVAVRDVKETLRDCEGEGVWIPMFVVWGGSRRAKGISIGTFLGSAHI